MQNELDLISDNKQDKILDKIRKLFLLAESEEAIGNFGAAINISAKAKELLDSYKLSSKDLMNERERIEWDLQNQVGKTLLQNSFVRANARNRRLNWFEELAKVVASFSSCKFSVESNGDCVFYGFSIDREVASLTLKHLAKSADYVCAIEMKLAKENVGKTGFDMKTRKTKNHLKAWIGNDEFIESFHFGFRESIIEAFKNGNWDKVDDKVLSYFNRNSDYSNQSRPFRLKDEDINLYAKEFGRIAGSKISEKKLAKISNETGIVSLRKETKYIPQLGKGGVFLAVDGSSSMDDSFSYHGNDKIGQAKRGAENFAKTAIEQGFAVGIISFDSKAKTVFEPSMELNGNFKRAIASIKAEGSTNMNAAIKEAMHQFLSRKNKRILVIITDGNPTHDYYDENSDYSKSPKDVCLETARLAKVLGIEIRTIGTEDADFEFLKKLASNPNLALSVNSKDLELTIGNAAKQLTSGSIEV